MNLLHLIFLLTFSCSNNDKANDDSKNKSEIDLTGSIKFTGYVQNAFEVEVNGNKYSDIEQYFTEQSQDLKSLISKAGYDGYKYEFAAEIGLNDLWNGMEVYISPKEQRGFMGKSNVSNKGEFNIELPIEANDSEYQVRANKRIGIKLSLAEVLLNFCYNFSAADKQVEFSTKLKPIILDKFSTSLTKYDCGAKKDELAIPISPVEQLSKTITKNKSTKADVLRILGETMLVIHEGYYCWHDNNSIPEQCDIDAYNNCKCAVSFDKDGKVSGQTNINKKYLDILSF